MTSFNTARKLRRVSLGIEGVSASFARAGGREAGTPAQRVKKVLLNPIDLCPRIATGYAEAGCLISESGTCRSPEERQRKLGSESIRAKRIHYHKRRNSLPTFMRDLIMMQMMWSGSWPTRSRALSCRFRAQGCQRDRIPRIAKGSCSRESINTAWFCYASKCELIDDTSQMNQLMEIGFVVRTFPVHSSGRQR